MVKGIIKGRDCRVVSEDGFQKIYNNHIPIITLMVIILWLYAYKKNG